VGKGIVKRSVYLRLEEAVTKYGLEPEFLSRAVERGIVRAIRVNGHIAVVAEDVCERIRPGEMAQLADILQSVAEVIPRITEPIPAVTRDPKDDYFIAYALVGEADYLVTGDKDLLVLEEVGTLRILTPRAFWGVLNHLRGDRV